jgi:hypothetical protein
MKFPKPIFDELKRYYETKPESVHECSRIYRKTTAEADVYTSAVRMCEALVLATRLVRSRADIPALNEFGGDGKSLLLGRYGYKANLCPHGLGRGARDVAFFLQDNWGRPTSEWLDVQSIRASIEDKSVPTHMHAVFSNLRDRIGIVGFFNIRDFPGQGALALFDKDTFIGKPYWNCRTMKFWKLD